MEKNVIVVLTKIIAMSNTASEKLKDFIKFLMAFSKKFNNGLNKSFWYNLINYN